MAHYTTAGPLVTGAVIQMKYKHHWVSGHHNLSSNSGWVSHGDEADFKFTFTPKFSTSTIMLEYFQPVTHTSTGGGYGYMAFTREGARNDWGGGIANYSDSVGHFWTGFYSYAGMYNSGYGRLVYQNNDTNAFELGLDVKHAAAEWYYAHSSGFCHMQATEFYADCSG